jgi:hypothetical protein
MPCPPWPWGDRRWTTCDCQGAFLGAFSLLREMPEVRRYSEATQAVFEAMPAYPSIVSGSILSALAGEYGDHHRTARYPDAVKRTENYGDLMDVIDYFRSAHPPTRARAAIPDASFARRVSR